MKSKMRPKAKGEDNDTRYQWCQRWSQKDEANAMTEPKTPLMEGIWPMMLRRSRGTQQ